MFRLSTNPSLTILKYFSFLHHFWLNQRLKLYPGDVIKSVLRCDSSLMMWTFSSDNKTNEFSQQIICINIFCQWKAPAQWTQFHKTIRLRLIFKLVLIRTIELPLNSWIKYFYLEKYLCSLPCASWPPRSLTTLKYLFLFTKIKACVAEAEMFKQCN